jgi:NAD(P)-dependent dehydrogenase (short-subunit alcohol dehydrogenase family)
MTAKRFALQGKRAVVAGESHYWSRYLVAALASAGADVAVIGKESARLDAAVAAAGAAGTKGLRLVADSKDAAQTADAIGRAVAEFGGIDILVNAADIPLGKPFLETTAGEWRSVMDGNLESVANCCRAAGPHMLAQKKGRIVNVVSCLAERGMANSAAYCVSMGGVLQLTRALALEWALDGITVNAVGAGWFTEDAEAAANAEDPLVRYIPAKHYGSPDDISSTVVYLASDVTGFTTGQFMTVDGGLTSHA